MPNALDMPLEALKFVGSLLMKDLGDAKMWPIKLAHMKHQEALRSFA